MDSDLACELRMECLQVVSSLPMNDCMTTDELLEDAMLLYLFVSGEAD